MRNDFENDFKETMDAIRFSPEQKTHMAKNILKYQSLNEKRGNINMNKWTLPKVAAFAAAGLLATGGTVFATSKIAMYTSSSGGDYDYSSVAEINSAAEDLKEKVDADMPDLPDALGDYSFDGGKTVTVSGNDNAGNTLGKWDDLHAVYKNEDGASINLTLSYNLSDDEDRTPTESRKVSGITVDFNHDEYLLLPDEDEPLSESVKERMENDDHFFVSYGGENETYFFSNVSFIKDGLRYLIFTDDDISSDDLFSMAEELISK